MRDVLDETQAGTNRRSFIKKGIVTAAGATVGAGLLTDISPAIAQDGGLNTGDAAILRFLSALVEQIEQDLWAAIRRTRRRSKPLPANFRGCSTGGSPAFPATAALNNLLMGICPSISTTIPGGRVQPSRVHQRVPGGEGRGHGRSVSVRHSTWQSSGWGQQIQASDHEPHGTHGGHQFLDPVSQPHEEPRPPRSQLRVSPSGPDLVQWEVSRRSLEPNADLSPKNHIQAIANTAAFHFCSYIEQGGSKPVSSAGPKAQDR